MDNKNNTTILIVLNILAVIVLGYLVYLIYDKIQFWQGMREKAEVIQEIAESVKESGILGE